MRKSARADLRWLASLAPQGDGSEIARLAAAAIVLLFATAHSRRPPCPPPRPSWCRSTSRRPLSRRGPHKGLPFVDAVNGRAARHTRAARGIYWRPDLQRPARVLRSRALRWRRPAVIVVFLHESGDAPRATCRPPAGAAQVAESGLNAVLVAPQSRSTPPNSAVGFWRRAYSQNLTRRSKADAAARRPTRRGATFEQAPVVIVAYSGGYNPAASRSRSRRQRPRTRVVLLDGLFAEIDKFADWIARHPQAFSSRLWESHAQRARRAATPAGRAPRERPDRGTGTLDAGQRTLLPVGDECEAQRFRHQAWVKDPLKAVLAKCRVSRVRLPGQEDHPGQERADGA